VVGVHVAGSPAGPGRREGGAWRRRVAAAVEGLPATDGVRLLFHVEPDRWIDLDTLTEEALAGLRDGGLLAARFAELDAFLAEKRVGTKPGLRIRPEPARVVAAVAPPGPCLVDVAGDVLPRPGRREEKARWRDLLAAGWGDRPPLSGDVWAEVRLGTARSLVTSLEPALDALEPILGRDPRGRDWQRFFPNDDRIVWLRVQREPLGPPIRLRLGRFPQAMDSGGASAPRSRPRAHDQA
jgi:hypothetical protein